MKPLSFWDTAAFACWLAFLNIPIGLLLLAVWDRLRRIA